ncbi:OLC1v1031243C1 [Oldenlandia corymbosa var. corymbosa]|uniref:OLC1v1031243C1 n=1 Tax=Oldenlandia corymbosa var. corymbosa TaxID=529605 RepID=A0AAV1CIH3_OLDCO|nr:OLC1v1031243C1 [Oldenlandia corymbosa var. corymbosa]
MSNFHEEIHYNGNSFLPSTSLELLLKHCSTRVKRPRDEYHNDQTSNLPDQQRFQSTVQIMKQAKEQLRNLNSQNADVISSVFSFVEAQYALGYEISLEMALGILLQAAAEKIDNQQYVYGRKLLSLCRQFSSKDGISPTQRLTHYFVEALQEKTDRECGIALPSSEEIQQSQPMDEKLALLNLQPEILAGQQENPFSLVCQFMAVGSIRDGVGSAEKVHLIDFSIDNGSHWILIMQDFAGPGRRDFPLRLLKITAVGTCRWMMEETGQRLSAFAESINLAFRFDIVVSDLKDLRKDPFELEEDEVVAVHVATRFWTLLAWPNYLDSLIETIKSLKPCVMVVKEMEAGTNKNSFLERFDEALIYISGSFDIAKECMENHVLYRKLWEEFCSGKMIRNILTAEGVERIHRHEKIGFWRSLFGKFEIVETELSRPSLYRARLLLKRSARFSPFTIDKDGECFVLGWKGNPFLSISAWKFPEDHSQPA